MTLQWTVFPGKLEGHTGGLAQAAGLFDHPHQPVMNLFLVNWNLCKVSTCAGDGLDDSEENN